MPINIDSLIVEAKQLVKGLKHYPQSLDLFPPNVEIFHTDNFYQRTLSWLIANSDNQAYVLECTDAGILKVAESGSGFENYESVTGTSADAYSAALLPAPSSRYSRFDLLIETYDAVISYRNDADDNWQDDIIIKAGSASMDFTSANIRIKNRNAGQSAVYQIVGYF